MDWLRPSASYGVQVPHDELMALLRYCDVTKESPTDVVATLLRDFLEKKKFYVVPTKTGGKPI